MTNSDEANLFHQDEGRPHDDQQHGRSTWLTAKPRVIQIVRTPAKYANHSYKDYSSVVDNDNDTFPTELAEMSFPQKVFHMLSHPMHSEIIHWMPHGRSFKVRYPRVLEETICHMYFGHKRYSSFLRQLSNHGFRIISQGPDRNCHYHELILRGMPHLCKLFPKPRDSRNLKPDPENEPDFEAISKRYPLPGRDMTSPMSKHRSELLAANESTPLKREPTESIDCEESRTSKRCKTADQPVARLLKKNQGHPNEVANEPPSAATTGMPLILSDSSYNDRRSEQLTKLGLAIVLLLAHINNTTGQQ